jgi:hypothetical protein
MSDGRDGQRRDSDPDEENDVFDSLGEPETDVDDPFAELGLPESGRARSVDGATGTDEWSDEAADLDDAFEQMDVGGPAEEDVWESLDADAGTDDWPDDGAERGGETSAPGEGDTEHVVSKRTYCQRCPHFTSPPEVACTHEGTTVVEAVGFDEFRVRNCPMISEENPTFDVDR